MLSSERIQDLILPLSGGFCLALSSVLLYCSVGQELGSASSMWYLTGARFAGIGSFISGVAAVFHARWTLGVVLIVGSTVLPFVSLFIHGTP